jgi:hypothetical protein
LRTRIRRKKCDEEKPFCRRCTSTGRKCDGYPTQQPSPPTSTSDDSPPSQRVPEPGSKRQKTTADIANGKVAIPATASKPTNSSGFEDNLMNQLCRPPSRVVFDSDNDFFCFDFFRSRTGPDLGAYFDSSIWRTYAVRACLQHPTVMAAAAAVGAVHRRYELGISREAFEYCDLSGQLYKKALRMLADDMASDHPGAAEINMMTMKMFSVYETFQGNYDLAQAHMTAGLKGLLNRKMRTTYKDTQYRTVDLTYESLRRLFLKLELESVRLFGALAKILSEPEESMPTPTLNPFTSEASILPDPNPYPIPRAFTSLSLARDVLFTEAKWIWHTWTLLEQGLLVGTGFGRHQAHISRLLQWSMAYAEYSKVEANRRGSRERHVSGQLLRTYREAAYLLILAQMAFHSPDTGAVVVPLCDPPELCDCHRSCRTYAERKEALNAHFARLLVLSESILNRGSFFAYQEQHSISVDSGIGPPLYLGSPRCRSTKVRHQVTSLLDQSEIQRRVWDTLGVYTIAEKLSSIEEHAVVNCGAVADALQPKWVDITFFLDERRALLRYCTADREGQGGRIRGTGLVSDDYSGSGSGGLVWTQEWIAF